MEKVLRVLKVGESLEYLEFGVLKVGDSSHLLAKINIHHEKEVF
jgi:hypothetical protein